MENLWRGKLSLLGRVKGKGFQAARVPSWGQIRDAWGQGAEVYSANWQGWIFAGARVWPPPATHSLIFQRAGSPRIPMLFPTFAETSTNEAFGTK